MTSKQKRLNTELHRKVSALTKKTKDFFERPARLPWLKRRRSRLDSGSKSCPHLGITHPAQGNRLRAPCRDPSHGKGREAGQGRALLGKGGAQSQSPRREEGGRGSPLHRQLQLLCCGSVWLCSPRTAQFYSLTISAPALGGSQLSSSPLGPTVSNTQLQTIYP